MAAKILFGFGGVKFERSGFDDATFTGGIGRITYSPVQRIYTNIDEVVISRLIGFRVNLEIDELYNIGSDDWEQYQNLAYILSDLVDNFTQKTVTITPRNDTSITNNLSYSCILTSDFSPEDIHRVKTGQKLSLTFQEVGLKQLIPTVFSDSTAGIYWDGTDQYYDGTDTYYNGLG